MGKSQISAALAVAAFLFGSRATPASDLARYQRRPRLFVVLVIDQFRADYLTRFSDRFLPAQSKGKIGGFQWLMSRGAYYPFARYDVLQSMTCPGHAMILSGSYPYLNGINLNEWYDASTRKLTYCAHDPDSPTLAPPGANGVVPPDEGVSPRNFTGSTFGDELKNAGLRSQVAAIALKDRAAIFLGGRRADVALWMSNDLSWTSSRYYAKGGELPSWIAALNQRLVKRKGEPYAWLGVRAKIGDRKSFASPLGVELTADAALAAVRGMKLGAKGATDLLAVSFSSHDMLGHETGPNTREMEELTLAEDRILSRFLNDLKNAVPGGLDDVVIALTGDHGVASTVASMKAAGVPSGFIADADLLRDGEKALRDRFGEAPNHGKWIAALSSFNFYFDREALAKKKIAIDEAEAALKGAFAKTEGIAFAFSRADRDAKRLPPGMHARQIERTFVDARSGDVILVPQPFYMESGHAASHVTGYAYDRTVPLLLSGPGVKPGVRSEEANVVDLAPTLSFLAGVLPPALSEGRALSESLR